METSILADDARLEDDSILDDNSLLDDISILAYNSIHDDKPILHDNIGLRFRKVIYMYLVSQRMHLIE